MNATGKLNRVGSGVLLLWLLPAFVLGGQFGGIYLVHDHGRAGSHLHSVGSTRVEHDAFAPRPHEHPHPDKADHDHDDDGTDDDGAGDEVPVSLVLITHPIPARSLQKCEISAPAMIRPGLGCTPGFATADADVRPALHTDRSCPTAKVRAEDPLRGLLLTSHALLL